MKEVEIDTLMDILDEDESGGVDINTQRTLAMPANRKYTNIESSKKLFTCDRRLGIYYRGLL